MIVISETLAPVIILQCLRQDMLDGDLPAEVLGDRFILIRLFNAQQNRLSEGPTIDLPVNQRTELFIVRIAMENGPNVVG